MARFLCSKAHLHKSQWGATNCHWCKKRQLKEQLAYEKERKERHVEGVVKYAKRLADYVRLGIETGTVLPASPIAVAYADFMTEWKLAYK